MHWEDCQFDPLRVVFIYTMIQDSRTCFTRLRYTDYMWVTIVWRHGYELRVNPLPDEGYIVGGGEKQEEKIRAGARGQRSGEEFGMMWCRNFEPRAGHLIGTRRCRRNWWSATRRQIQTPTEACRVVGCYNSCSTHFCNDFVWGNMLA